jgi:putative SOS response-associated peptidase YedK
MCGRFTLTTPEQLIAEAFGLEEVPQLSARYNIAPSQPVAAIVQPASGRRLAVFRWGLIAPGESERDDLMLINVRSETAATKPLFREAFRSRRCLIPADGFYEWRKAGKRREPFHIRLRDRRPFAFAGVWSEEASDAGQAPVKACAILTTEPNELMAGIHDRMPVILDPASYSRWLDTGERATREARELLCPYPAEAMEAARVSSYVNAAGAEGPRCLEPERQGSLFD